MDVWVWVIVVVGVWIAVSIPLAILVGRMIARGRGPDVRPEEAAEPRAEDPPAA